MVSDAVTVFFSYSHKDKALRDELAKHLEALKFGGAIADWHDGEILPGDEWDKAIQANLNSAQIILLLVSADFIGSRYCRDVEIKQAMARHEAGEARVIPVILRKCLWHVTPFGKLQALPKNGTPVMDVSTWPTWDDAFYSVAEGIHKVASSFSASADPDTERQTASPTPKIPVQQTTENAQAKYRERVREYLAGHQLTAIHEVRLELLRKQLKLPEAEAQRILSEALAPIELKREAYREALSGFIEAGLNPVDEAIQNELKQIRRELELTEAEVTEIEQPILAAAEYRFEVLGSECGMSYNKLRDLLKAGEWKAADEETYKVMIRAVGKESGDYFTADELLNFPCGDLRIIDRL